MLKHKIFVLPLIRLSIGSDYTNSNQNMKPGNTSADSISPNDIAGYPAKSNLVFYKKEI